MVALRPATHGLQHEPSTLPAFTRQGCIEHHHIRHKAPSWTFTKTLLEEVHTQAPPQVSKRLEETPKRPRKKLK